MPRLRSTCLLLCTAAILAGCDSIEGIPQGLTDTNRTNLLKTDLNSQLTEANALLKQYETARNINMHYAFWSNIALIGLASGAAGAVAFKASTVTFSSIGIAAGATAGANTFFNARANAKVYQNGIGALTCELTNLQPFGPGNKTPPVYNALSDEVSKDALLTDTSDMTSLAQPELKTMMTDMAALQQAITDADTAIEAAKTSAVQFSQLPSFTANITRSIDQAVAGKISQSDVSYATLVSSINSAAAPPSSAKSPNNSKSPEIANDKSAPPNPSSIQAYIKKVEQATKDLKAQTTALTATVTDFGLAAAETNATACIKLVTGG